MKKDDVVFVDGIRTPFVKAGMHFNNITAQQLGRTVIAELLERTELDPGTIDEVIMGNIGQPAEAANIARVAALMAGIPDDVPGWTVQRNCVSSMEAATSAYLRIKANDQKIFITGGMESMSNIPLLFTKDFANWMMGLMGAKTPVAKLMHLKKLKLKDLKPIIGLAVGLTDYPTGLNMGETAENLAREFEISRLEQDKFALNSHLKAAAATSKGVLREEIVPVHPGPPFKKTVQDDVGPRDGQTLEALQKLKPYFDRKYGTITVGNACPVTDGAVAHLIMRGDVAKTLGYKPIAKIRSWAYAALHPGRMGLGPAYSIPMALDKAGLTLDDMGVIEINEAFSAQALSCIKLLGSEKECQRNLNRSKVGDINLDKFNINGGAVAMGHPVASSAARIMLTGAKEMRRRKEQFAMVSLCVGGGQGGAMVLEAI